jgi:hypothetical protein
MEKAVQNCHIQSFRAGACAVCVLCPQLLSSTSSRGVCVGELAAHLCREIEGQHSFTDCNSHYYTFNLNGR